jgi:hypothetical protein
VATYIAVGAVCSTGDLLLLLLLLLQVELLSGLTEAIRCAVAPPAPDDPPQQLPPDVARDVERLPLKLMEYAEDAHVKVGPGG